MRRLTVYVDDDVMPIEGKLVAFLRHFERELAKQGLELRFSQNEHDISIMIMRLDA